MNVFDVQQQTLTLLFFYSIFSQREHITPQASVFSSHVKLWNYWPNINSRPPTGTSGEIFGRSHYCNSVEEGRSKNPWGRRHVV